MQAATTARVSCNALPRTIRFSLPNINFVIEPPNFFIEAPKLIRN